MKVWTLGHIDFGVAFAKEDGYWTTTSDKEVRIHLISLSILESKTFPGTSALSFIIGPLAFSLAWI